MAINFNIDPYWDDFDDTKNYHKILFRPGYAVQARELTQLQTQLQDQIKKFGKHVFVNGTVVTGGNRLFDLKLTSIKLNATYSTSTVVVSNFNGKTIVGGTSGTRAVVKAVAENDGADPKTLLVSITSGGPFIAGENIETDEVDSHTATIQASDPFNDAMSFSIDTGIFFVDGKFVYLEAQSIAIDKYTNTSSKKIGLVLNEVKITSDDDSSILDNAQGSPNYAAPGADRYHAYLTLKVIGLDETYEGFIEIGRVVDGAIATNKDKTVYSELGKELARRTFDESGDYTVKAWPIHIADDVSGATGASGVFTVSLDPGKAYIKGFEFETLNQTSISLDRARGASDFETVTGRDVNLNYGNYVYVNNLTGPIWTNTDDTTPYTLIELHNVVQGSVTDSTTRIGTAKVRFIELHDTDSSSHHAGGNSVYKLFLFDIAITGSYQFNEARSIVYHSGSGAYKTASANIDDLSSLGGSIGATGAAAYLGGADSPGLVFPIPNQYIKTIKDLSGNSHSNYRLQRTYNQTFSDGKIAFSLSGHGDETFYGNVGEITSDDIKDYYYHVVITESGGTELFPVGAVASFANINNRKITISDEGKTIEFNFNDGGFLGSAVVICTIEASNQGQKNKTISGWSKVVIGTGSSGGLNTTIGGKDSLARSDIYKVKHVYLCNADPSAVDVNADGEITDWKSITLHPEVTSRYIVDDGQRAEFYDHGNLILNGTAPNSAYYLLVVYKNFSHGGDGYLSIDSYPVDTIGYGNIPTFTDPSTGVVYNLRDCIDFRPRRTDGGVSFVTGAQIATPTATLNATYQYWLGRIDKIIATQDQTFVIKKGISAVYPQAPIDESNGMTIYALVIPPYTANVRDIQIKYVENRRYTMRDIGKLEKRISNLEYYTQLSILEKQAKDTSIKGSNTLEKFKNGFATDPFTSQDVFTSGSSWTTRRWDWWLSWFNGNNSWNVSSTTYNENSLADAANVDFDVAIDPLNQELRAPFSVQYNQFDVSGATGAVRNGDLVTLPYTEDIAINQPLASSFINVNPFNVIRFIGTVTLEPAFDLWVDTIIGPDINLLVDTLVPGTIEQDERIDNNRTRFHSEAGGHPWHVASTSVTFGTNVLNSTTTNLGTSVVDVQYVPYIRESVVLGLCRLFKPKARLYPFVESASISAYVKPLTILKISGVTGSGFIDTHGAYENLSIRTSYGTPASQENVAKVAIYSEISTTELGVRLLTISGDAGTTIDIHKYVVGMTSNTHAYIESVYTYTLTDPLIPDEFGNIGFEFQVPSNVFKTGERTIRLIDNSTNNVQTEESIGEAKYTAIGQIQTKSNTILTTRTLQNTKTVVETGYYDPIAESFMIYPNEYPLGLHVSSVDVYFKSKSNAVPIEMQIRRNVNGYPESVPTIPFSSVILKASEVSVSDDSNTATKFTFANPIHLTPGEYSIVLLTNTQDYNVFIGEIGQPIIGSTTKIDKQPYIGSLFKSQNASTWEPDQNKDLKFKLNRAVFASGATGAVEFTIQDPESYTDYHTLFTHVSSILPTGTAIQWYSKSYKYAGGATGDLGRLDPTWTPLNVNQDVTYKDLRQLDTQSHATDNTLQLKAELSIDTSIVTKNEVSPVIDVATVSAITALNTINNLSTGEEGVVAGGPALARYITKPINLAAGFEASNINVTVDVNKPQNTDIKVYYRTLPTDKTTPIADEEWVLMELENSVALSLSNYDFKEHRYFPAGAFVGNVPVNDPISPRFNAFQIKIVLLSSNAAYTPRLRDLRVIALDS